MSVSRYVGNHLGDERVVHLRANHDYNRHGERTRTNVCQALPVFLQGNDNVPLASSAHPPRCLTFRSVFQTIRGSPWSHERAHLSPKRSISKIWCVYTRELGVLVGQNRVLLRLVYHAEGTKRKKGVENSAATAPVGGGISYYKPKACYTRLQYPRIPCRFHADQVTPPLHCFPGWCSATKSAGTKTGP